MNAPTLKNDGVVAGKKQFEFEVMENHWRKYLRYVLRRCIGRVTVPERCCVFIGLERRKDGESSICLFTRSNSHLRHSTDSLTTRNTFHPVWPKERSTQLVKQKQARSRVPSLEWSWLAVDGKHSAATRSVMQAHKYSLPLPPLAPYRYKLLNSSWRMKYLSVLCTVQYSVMC